MSHISRNENLKKTCCIFSKGSFSYTPKKGKPKKLFIFQETELSSTSGGTSKAPKAKIYYTSPKKVTNKFF